MNDKELEEFRKQLYGKDFYQTLYKDVPSKSNTKKDNGIGKVLWIGAIVLFLIYCGSQSDSVEYDTPLTQQEIREQCKTTYEGSYEDYLWCMRINNL